MATQLPMDSPQDEALYLRELPAEERRKLVGAMLKRFLMEQEARKAMAARRESLILKLLAQATQKSANEKVAEGISPELAKVLRWGAAGAGLGTLGGLMAGAKEDGRPRKEIRNEVLKRMARLGVTGGLIGAGLGRASATQPPASTSRPADVLLPPPRENLSRQLQKIIKKTEKARRKGASMSHQEKSALVMHFEKVGLEFPGGRPAPAQIAALIGAGAGGLGGLLGAKATEKEDEGYGSRLLKRLGLGAAGLAGGAMLGSVVPGMRAAYQEGGLPMVGKMKDQFWDIAKTVPVETAKKIPEWSKGLLSQMKGPAAGPAPATGAGPAVKVSSIKSYNVYISKLGRDMNQALGKTAKVKREGDKWVLYTKDGSRVLGKHDSAGEAYAQEKAIKSSKKEAAKTDAPNYREASTQQRCGTCDHYKNGRCELYDFNAKADYTCDAWIAKQGEKEAADEEVAQAGPQFPLREQALKGWNPRAVLQDPGSGQEITPEEFAKIRSGGLHPLSATLGAVLGGGGAGAAVSNIQSIPKQLQVPLMLAGLTGGGALGNYLQSLRMKGKARGEMEEFGQQFPAFMRSQMESLPPEAVEQQLAQLPPERRQLTDETVLQIPREALRQGLPKVPQG